MNKELQKVTIARQMTYMGYDPDKFDLEAEIDSELSLPVNKQRISRKYGLKLSNDAVQQKIRQSSYKYLSKAKKIFDSWSKQRRSLDQKFRADETFDGKSLKKADFEKWKSNPQRYDITGVDYLKGYSKPIDEFRGRDDNVKKDSVLSFLRERGSAVSLDRLFDEFGDENEEDIMFVLDELENSGVIFESSRNYWEVI